MIKLPNFRTCVEINNLLSKMGIINTSLRPLPERVYEHEVEKKIVKNISPGDYLKFKEQLENDGVDISNKEFKSNRNTGLLEVDGVSCCIYIKNQNHSFRNKEYRYHLCECSTIIDMITKGRKARYVATSRSDGYFPVHIQYGHRAEKKLVILELCSNCRRILIDKGIYKRPFSLKKFFLMYKSPIKYTYQREETVVIKEKYAPDHKQIAQEYKRQVNYRCQICGLDLSSNHKLLHMHHKNGDGQCNEWYNLEIICAFCHSLKSHHAHMKPKFNDEINLCKQLQKEQGIHSIASSWESL